MSRRKLYIMIGLASLLVLAAVGVWIGIWLVAQQQRQQTNQTTVKPEIVEFEPTPKKKPSTAATLIPRLIDGVLVPTAEANLYPIAVMIENAAFGGVRPQAGLSSASVVYEMLVEGGITRLMAVYAGPLPTVIGPVRSARPTYLEFSSEYNAIYVHAGGSPEALAATDGLGIIDLSALTGDSRYFYREGSKAAPHNLFTSNELLELARRDKNLISQQAEFDSWLFKTDNQPKAEPSSARTITIDFGSGPLYAVQYRYDYATNDYRRLVAQEEQIDAVTGEVIHVSNVIVQQVPAAIAAGENRVNFDVTGEGKVYVARDDEVIEGNWRKANRTSRTLWYDAAGKEIELNRGSVWIEILPITGTIEYTK